MKLTYPRDTLICRERSISVEIAPTFFSHLSIITQRALALHEHPRKRHTMATVPPPPSKRQKLAAETAKAEALEATRIPENLGSVRVQFADSTSGHATGTPISIPIAQASAKNLEHLLNDLMGNVCASTDSHKYLILKVNGGTERR